MPHQYKVIIVDDLNGLRGLDQEWNDIALPQKVAPWQSFSWIEAAATAFGRDQALRVITVRKDDRLVAIAPLMLKHRQQPLNPIQMEFLGGVELREPNGFVALDYASLEQLIAAVISEHAYPIRLFRIPRELENTHSIVTRFKQAGWLTPVMSMPYPYLALETNPIKKSLREDLKRARRKAEAHGKVMAEVVNPATPEALQEHLDNAFRIEGSGWKGENHTAITSDEHRKTFFERYAFSAWKDGTLRLSFLKINGTLVAEQYAIETADSYWLLNIGYDEAYRDCSPGNLLLEESIKYAAGNGLLRYNFLGTEEPWITRWTKTTHECFILAAYRLNLCGLIALCSDIGYSIIMRNKEGKTKAQSKRGR
ncbi:MAG: GNAT family N-acetyltransferase [Anaerolineae bacterium]|nr:GNAT family N-acetyltransferase [Anaerolineae bacterium]